MTFFVTWQSRVALDSIRNFCDFYRRSWRSNCLIRRRARTLLYPTCTQLIVFIQILVLYRRNWRLHQIRRIARPYNTGAVWASGPLEHELMLSSHISLSSQLGNQSRSFPTTMDKEEEVKEMLAYFFSPVIVIVAIFLVRLLIHPLANLPSHVHNCHHSMILLPTPRNALSVRPSVGHVFYPHLTRTHTNQMSERAR